MFMISSIFHYGFSNSQFSAKYYSRPSKLNPSVSRRMDQASFASSSNGDNLYRDERAFFKGLFQQCFDKCIGMKPFNEKNFHIKSYT